MAIKIKAPEPRKQFDMASLRRLGAWAGAAAVAVAAVVVIAQTDMGAERLKLAFSDEARPAMAAARIADKTRMDAEKDAETQRLRAQLRALAADRDRLAVRIASLERNLEDMTGSIRRELAQVTAPSPPPAISEAAATPAPLAMPAATGTIAAWPHATRTQPDAAPPSPLNARIQPQAQLQEQPHVAAPASPPDEPPVMHLVPMPPASPMRVAAVTAAATPSTSAAKHEPENENKRELGVDLGGTRTMEILNERWLAVKANFGPYLGGLHPLVAHDRRPNALPFRLLVGPLPNGAAAASLCAHFAASRVSCRTVRFSGDQFAKN